MPKFLEKVPVRLSGGVSQQSISEGSDGNTQLADHVFPSGPEVFTGMRGTNRCSFSFVSARCLENNSASKFCTSRTIEETEEDFS